MAKKQTATTEIAVITPLESPEVLTIIEKSGLELQEAQNYAKQFAPYMEKVTEAGHRLSLFDRANITPEMVKEARRLRLDLVENRGSKGAKGTKEQAKEKILIHGRIIDNLFGLVENTSKAVEFEAEEIEKHFAKIEADRKAALTANRIALLTPYEVDTIFLPLGDMDEEQFSNLLSRSKESFDAVQEKRAREEAERREAEQRRLDQEAVELLVRELYSARIKIVLPLSRFTTQDIIDSLGEISESDFTSLVADLKEKERVEAEEKEAIRLDNERLKKEAEEKERLAEIERRRLEEERIAADVVAKKQQAERDRIVKEQADKLAAAEKALRERREAEELAHQKEKERIEAEEAEKRAAEKAALLAPDREKCRLLFESIKAISVPEFATEEGKKLAKEITEGLTILKNGLISASKTLL